MSGHSDIWCTVEPCEDCQEQAEERERDRYYEELSERKKDREARIDHYHDERKEMGLKEALDWAIARIKK